MIKRKQKPENGNVWIISQINQLKLTIPSHWLKTFVLIQIRTFQTTSFCKCKIARAVRKTIILRFSTTLVSNWNSYKHYRKQSFPKVSKTSRVDIVGLSKSTILKLTVLTLGNYLILKKCIIFSKNFQNNFKAINIVCKESLNSFRSEEHWCCVLLFLLPQQDIFSCSVERTFLLSSGLFFRCENISPVVNTFSYFEDFSTIVRVFLLTTLPPCNNFSTAMNFFN